jgi:N-acetylmuramoyl-L-alanine amidase
MRGFRYLLVAVPIAALIAAAPALAAQRYTVRWGDTLTGIASAHGVSLRQLARANHMRLGSLLLAGTTLRIPGHGHGSSGGHRITVQWGDTLSGIAARYGTTLTHLAAINGISPFGVLPAGSHLRVPGSAAAPAMAASGSFDAVGSLDRWAAHYGVDPRLARAVAWMESGYRTGAVSSVGARGVMQVMPATWRFTERLIGHPVARTADGNVRIGVAYLHHLLNVFGGDQRLALAAYYQGPAGVRRFGMLRVTERYVADVVALEARM